MSLRQDENRGQWNSSLWHKTQPNHTESVNGHVEDREMKTGKGVRNSPRLSDPSCEACVTVSNTDSCYFIHRNKIFLKISLLTNIVLEFMSELWLEYVIRIIII